MRKFEHLKENLDLLLKQGRQLELALVFDLMTEEQAANLSSGHRKFAEALKGTFKRDYHGWYGKSLMLIRQLVPEKYEEFASYFLASPKRRAIQPITKQLRSWLDGESPAFHQYDGGKFLNGAAIVSAFFSNQLQILEAAKLQTESTQAPCKIGIPALLVNLAR